MEKIALILPTRNRPAGLIRFWNSVLETVLDIENINLYLYIDDDDMESLSAVKFLKEQQKIFITVGPRITMSNMANVLYEKNQGEDIFFLVADDLVMRTDGWDDKIFYSFDFVKDKIVLFYGNDLNTVAHPPNFGTHPILHRKWIEALGYLQYPYFESDYADTWLNDLANLIGRKAMIPIINEHMHYTVGKSKMDQTYMDSRIRFQYTNPPKQYSESHGRRLEDAEKLRGAMDPTLFLDQIFHVN